MTVIPGLMSQNKSRMAAQKNIRRAPRRAPMIEDGLRPGARRSLRLAQKCKQSPEQTAEEFIQVRTGGRRPSHETMSPDSHPQDAGQKAPATESAPGREAPRASEGTAAPCSEETPAYMPTCGNEKCNYYRCIPPQERLRRRGQPRRHIPGREGTDAVSQPSRNGAEALGEKSIGTRFDRLRITKPSIPLRNPMIKRLSLNKANEQRIRQEEAEGERYCFSRYFGVTSETGREEVGNRPFHYNQNWITQRSVSERKLWNKGMYRTVYRHVHDQLYFTDEVGNKLWIVDDKGESLLAQDQDL